MELISGINTDLLLTYILTYIYKERKSKKYQKCNKKVEQKFC